MKIPEGGAVGRPGIPDGLPGPPMDAIMKMNQAGNTNPWPAPLDLTERLSLAFEALRAIYILLMELAGRVLSKYCSLQPEHCQSCPFPSLPLPWGQRGPAGRQGDLRSLTRR